MNPKVLIVAVLTAGVVEAAGLGWRNLEPERQLGGRKASEGYLRGKVVMVYKGGDQMARMEQIWQSFKSKQFVLLGAGSGKSVACTFPQYAGAGLAENEPAETIYVVNGAGKVAYRGNDERAATEAIVMALTDLEEPRTLAQWKAFFDFELENLPAHAYLRAAAFKRKFPAASKDYEEKIRELRAVKGVDKVARLVGIAKQAKDMGDPGPKKKYQQARMLQAVKASIPKFKALLKDIEDERLVQEAKNALADLSWKVAES